MILTLGKLWINRIDTGEAISGWSAQERSQSFQQALEVKTYANGRRRSVTAKGEQGELGFRLQMVDQTTKDLMRTWIGISVQVRDHRGQKWFGVFASVDAGEYMEPTLYNVGFTLQLTSVTEGV